MILEARAESCFSSIHLLKINGQAVGKFEGRYFSDALDLALTGLRRFKFERPGVFKRVFQLKDAESGAVLSEAQPAGMFSAHWMMKLSDGPAELRKTGWFRSGYELKREGTLLARVDRLGGCNRGWQVTTVGELPAPDLLLVGLVYHVIRKREEQAAAAAAAHGS
jgi:hypothetical protein